MIIILDRQTNKVLRNMGTNSMFPAGDIPNVPLLENEIAVRVHDESQEAQQIMEAHEYSIVPKMEQIYEEDEDGNEILKDSYYVIDTLTVTKTKAEYQAEYEQSNEFKRQQILQELQELDKVIIRPLESFAKDKGYIFHESVESVINKKIELRQQLQALGE